MRVIVVIDESDHMKPKLFQDVAALERHFEGAGIVLSPGDHKSLLEALDAGRSWTDSTTYFGWHKVQI